MAVLDQRMLPWRAEAAAKGGDLGGAELLLAEHQHRIFGECALDPGESRVVKLIDAVGSRVGDVDPVREW